ncbi:MAG: hypothetical protein ABJJ69_16410 [Paracoccaceae bacterium]
MTAEAGNAAIFEVFALPASATVIGFVVNGIARHVTDELNANPVMQS